MNDDWWHDCCYECCLCSMLSPRVSRPPRIRFGHFGLRGSRGEKWRNFYAPRNASGPFPMLEVFEVFAKKGLREQRERAEKHGSVLEL